MRVPLCMLIVVVHVAGGLHATLADCGPDGQDCQVGRLGDLDLDGDVDVTDYRQLAACLAGPGVGPPPAECSAADLDLDDDSDLQDFVVLITEFTGACACPPNLNPPVVLFETDTYLGEAPLTVSFDGTRTWDGEAVITSYAWDFGDGGVDSGPTAVHTFTDPGEYTVTLTVTDAGGLSSESTRVITVSDGTFSLGDPISENDARRFLWQAAFGPDPAAVDFIVANGFEAWIDAQFALPSSRILWEDQQLYQDLGYGGTNPGYVWDDLCVEAADQLRQRVAWALIQLLVVNQFQDDGGDHGNGFYYSEYVDRAFGNYRDLLEFVTFSHQMGTYLTYIGNWKADPETGSEPDENYAREMLQLFTIGLWELNLDGTLRRNEFGEPIPTYGNEQVKQFARIFTGLTWNDDVPWEEMALTPMAMSIRAHEFGAKQLLDYPGAIPAAGFIPAAEEPEQDEARALQDVHYAIDNVFWHPNCAPFISRQLIQRLVTSNPTPAYVERVATAFEGSGPYGTGTRGDLAAAIKAILLDDEARDPAYRSNPMYGLVKEPLVVRWGLYRVLVRLDRPAESFPFRIDTGPWNTMENFGQGFMQSPSVFNFYPPDYSPPGTELGHAKMLSPELKIYNDITAMAILDRLRWEVVVAEGEYESGRYDDWRALADDSGSLVDALDAELMHGTLSPEARQILVSTLDQVDGDTDRVRIAVWLIVGSPEFRVLK